MARKKAAQTGVKFLVDFYERGEVKYAAGKTYPETEETLREVAKGNAESASVDSGDADPETEASAEVAETTAAEQAPVADQATVSE